MRFSFANVKLVVRHIIMLQISGAYIVLDLLYRVVILGGGRVGTITQMGTY